jgi:fructoselysine-6-P-deglycase FrlB-like protein
VLHDRRFAASERFGALRCARVPGRPLKSDDATRPMADCAERFLRQYTPKLWFLDAAALHLGSLDPSARLLVANLVPGNTRLNRIAEHFASWMGRPLPDGRYMWKIEY